MKNGLFCPGGGQEKIFDLKIPVFFLSSKKYMKNICCYYFSSQHDAFLFFLTFFTLENNLEDLNTNRQKKTPYFQGVNVLNFSGGGRRKFDHFSMDSLVLPSLSNFWQKIRVGGTFSKTFLLKISWIKFFSIFSDIPWLMKKYVPHFYKTF